MKQSETKTIKRSAINFNPANIKTHSAEEIKQQKKNFRSVGYLGGIVYNEASGNLIDGHRRIAALDELYHYDGTPSTDYEVKVEAISLDAKTEKEQMAYQAIGNGKADYNLVANIIDEVDWKNIGITEDDYKQITALKAVTEEELESIGDMPMMEEDFTPKRKAEITELPDAKTNEEYAKAIEEKPKMPKEEVKEAKQHCKNVNSNYMDETENFVLINFENVDEKMAFCEVLGFEAHPNMVIAGKELLERIDM